MRRELSERKHPRLKRHDYSSDGAYFITFSVKDRHEMLGEVVGRDAPGALWVELSQYGTVIHEEIQKTRLHYANIEIDKFIVMPNHIHMIVLIRGVGDGAPRASRPTSAAIPNLVGVLKRKTNKIYGFKMWQTSYHDRVIRNEEEYQRIWRYIDQNPAKWEEDHYYVK